VNLFGNNTETTNKNTETLIDDSIEVVREIKIGTTKYMFISYYQNAVQILNIKIEKTLFENVS
jgi:hypothetical protein